MRQITLKIAPNSGEEIAEVGDYVRIKTASVSVRIESGSGKVDATIEQGDALNLQPFSRLRVSHSDAAEQTIVLLIGDKSSADSAKVGGSVAVSSVKNSGTVTHGQAAIVNGGYLAIAANAARRFMLIQNDDAAVDALLRFDGVAGSSAAIRLKPGQSITFDQWCCTQGVYLHGTAAGTGSSLKWVEGV